MSIFTGSGVALITPFTENGVNFDALGKLIDHTVKGKTDAMFILGTTGEPSTMTKSEKESVIDFTMKRVGKKIPVFVGSGGNNTADVIEWSKRVQSMGVDGLLVVTPYYNKCTQNGVLAHYKAVADAVKIPIVAYNVPTRTGFNMKPETIARLADIKNMAAVKEASGDIDQLLEVARLTKGKIDFYSGDDSLTVPAMSIGAKGVISVAANVIPEKVHNMAALCFNNQYEKACEIQFEIAPFVKSLFSEVNPIPCKKALQLMGFDVGIPRLPLTEMEPETTAKMAEHMRKLGLIK